MAFNQAIADRICERLAAGESLRKASAAEGVAPTTVLNWTEENKEFDEQYTRTRTRAYGMLAEQILEISDRSDGDTWTDDDGNVRTDAERVARAKLMVDSRKWILSKMLPKVYGDKLAIGGDADNPLTVTVQRLTEKAKP